MGGEHRIPRDPRLRKESNRGATGVSASVPGTIGQRIIPANRALAGIDVGENFLDLAIAHPAQRTLRYLRIGLQQFPDRVVERMADAVASEAPELQAGSIALVDSPRAPRDFDSRSMKHLGYEP